jgi:site-specific DNA-methyltransferase (adenine-specific)
MSESLFSAVGLAGAGRARIQEFALRAGVPVAALQYYDAHHKLPLGEHRAAICRAAGISEVVLMLRLGVHDGALVDMLRQHADQVAALLPMAFERPSIAPPLLAFETRLGSLYQGDCLGLLAGMADESVDVVFADPPFNLRKLYPSGIDDDLREKTYIAWCEEWLGECLRVLRPGGSLFVWNLPRWNSEFAKFLSGRATFRHWIAADLKYSLPIAGRLYPSHYSLLYFCKGPKPRVFHPDRLPMEICPHCLADLRDYGGYKDKMNPKGVSLTDVWFDIPPVRHSKYKKRDGANELSVRLLDRVIEMSSDEGDLVFDPFGGSGTTYAVAELKDRRWLGIEIGPVEDITRRLADLRDEAAYLTQIRAGYNQLFLPDVTKAREGRGLWTDRTIRLSVDGEEGDTYSEAQDGQRELPLQS